VETSSSHRVPKMHIHKEVQIYTCAGDILGSGPHCARTQWTLCIPQGSRWVLAYEYLGAVRESPIAGVTRSDTGTS